MEEEYKGFREISFSQNKRIKGAEVFLYNNDNGKYYSIHYGRDFKGFGCIVVSDYVEKLIGKIAIDEALSSCEIIEDNSATTIKFSTDFLLGVIKTVELQKKDS